MNKDPKVFIEHILESIARIEDYTKHITKKEFLNAFLSETKDRSK